MTFENNQEVTCPQCGNLVQADLHEHEIKAIHSIHGDYGQWCRRCRMLIWYNLSKDQNDEAGYSEPHQVSGPSSMKEILQSDNLVIKGLVAKSRTIGKGEAES
jgi:hypothetical protein